MEKLLTKDAILEIGTEEIPSSYLEPALEQVKEKAEKYLKERQLGFSGIKLYATPCRLALLLEGVEEKSKDKAEEILGPSAKVGRDDKGNWSPAAKGFAAKYGIDADKLVLRQTAKGEYLCVENKVPGEKAEKVLTGCFLEILKRIDFPKSMIWEETSFRFARPIRTIVAMYGEKKLKVQVADVKSNNFTVALHSSSNKKVTIRSAEKYADTLRNACVLADPQERKKVIERIIDSVSKRVKGNVLKDERLLDEVNYLVEHPVAVVGTFDEKYLKLPNEILTNCLAKKQKYFAIEDAKGRLLNSFLGIRNGMSENNEMVREGYERVLRARLEDAEFFFNKDTQSLLSAKTEKLKGVMFQAKLGSMYDKSQRMKELSKYIVKSIGIDVDPHDIDKACDLAKADLVTELVFEYPELQGAIGRIYAGKDNEKTEICQSIEEHYWPLNTESKLPVGNLATILALADKIDTLAGDFAAGLIPSGSYDPYGLRRLAVGILRILDEKSINLSIKNLAEKAFSQMGDKVRPGSDVMDALMEFFKTRLESILVGQGFAFDEVRAVLARGYDYVFDARNRVSAVNKIRKHSDFESLATAFKRASNILKQASKTGTGISDTINESLLTDESEKQLYNDIVSIEASIKQSLERKDYYEALGKIVAIKKSLDNFFEKVLVMAEDVNIRANRLALLNYVLKPFYSILDFSLLQGPEK